MPETMVRIKVTNDDEVVRSKVEERREVDGGVVDRRGRRGVDVEDRDGFVVLVDPDCLDFDVVVKIAQRRKVDGREGHVETDEEGEAASAAIRTITRNEVESRKRWWPAVSIPQLGLLKTANPDLVTIEKPQEFSRRILQTVAIPLGHKEGRQRRARIGVDTGDEEKKKDEPTSEDIRDEDRAKMT